MAKKPSQQTYIHGNVRVANGDLIAGDKTVTHQGSAQLPGLDNRGDKRQVSKPTSRSIEGGLDVRGGDVVFGDKIIKFFQKNLNIYLFKDVQQLLVFLGFFILISGAIGGSYWYSRQPKKMTGDYNIAIARFGEIQASGKLASSGTAETIRALIFNNLEGEYSQDVLGLNIQVAQRNMPLITEDSQAEALANKINADIVIYGRISVQPDTGEAVFRPRFYVAEQPDTWELTGPSELAIPIPFSLSELNTDEGLNLKLPARTEILFNFTRALIYYSQKDYSAALRTVKLAMHNAESLSEPFAGQEVLYLLAAKAYTRQGDYEEADQMLDQALLLNPIYARAHLGRGNIYYQQGKIRLQEGKPPTYNTELLLKAKSEYELALELPDGPQDAYIPIKARTNLGSVFLNLAFIQNGDSDLFAQATDHYLFVVHEFQRTKDPFLNDYAATAYTGLAGIYEHKGEMDHAREAYQAAYALTDDPDFMQEITGQLESLKHE